MTPPVAASRAEPVHFRGLAGRLVGDRWPARSAERRGVAVLMHGGGQTRHSWSGTASALAGAGWDAIALDTRGHGESDWAPDGDYETDALVGDLRRVVEQLGESPLLIGASLGGLTSLTAEGEHPGTARALVLVDVVPRVESTGVDRIVSFMTANQDGFASLDDAVEAVRAYNPNRSRPPTRQGLLKNLHLRGDRWYWHWDPAFLAHAERRRRIPDDKRATAAARRIDLPTLLVRGARSDVVSDDGVRHLLTLMPHASWVDIAETGHMVAGDDNDVFTRAVLEFLAERGL